MEYKNGDIRVIYNDEVEGQPDEEYIFKSDIIMFIKSSYLTSNKLYYYYKVDQYIASKNRWEYNMDCSCSWVDEDSVSLTEDFSHHFKPLIKSLLG